jgi:hypothetical protein
MTELHPELVRARRLFRELEPSSGSRARLMARLETRQKRGTGFGFGSRVLFFAMVTWASLSAAAYGSRWFAGPPRSTPSALEPATPGHPKRALRSGAKPPLNSRSNSLPATVPSALTGPASAAFPLEPPPSEPVLQRASKTSGAPSRIKPQVTERVQPPRASQASPRLNDQPAITSDSELSQQVAQYEQATTLTGARPAEALRLLRAFRQRWPSSALSHEVDLRVIQLLVQLGDVPNAKQEARAFLLRHTQSPRRSEVQRLAGTD